MQHHADDNALSQVQEVTTGTCGCSFGTHTAARLTHASTLVVHPCRSCQLLRSVAPPYLNVFGPLAPPAARLLPASTALPATQCTLVSTPTGLATTCPTTLEVLQLLNRGSTTAHCASTDGEQPTASLQRPTAPSRRAVCRGDLRPGGRPCGRAVKRAAGRQCLMHGAGAGCRQ